MIRGYTDTGSLYIGLVRGPLLDKLNAGERVCLPAFTDSNGVRHPHVCLFVGADNAELLTMTGVLFPDGFMPGAALDHVSDEEPT